MRPVRGAFVLTLTFLAAASIQCTASAPPPTSLVSPTPAASRHCIGFPIRAQVLDPSTMLQALDRHVPSSLPVGFGLVGLWGSGGGGSGDPKGFVLWVDASCRTISVTTWASSDAITAGPLVGSFTLTSSGPPKCSTRPLPCLVYKARLSPGLVEVDTVGLNRAAADEVVRSIQ